MFEDLYKAVNIFHENSTKKNDEIISQLEREFPEKGRNYFYFLPMAFARIILSRLGIETFPNTFKVQKGSGEEREFQILDQDIYKQSLDMGEAEISTEFTNRIEQLAFQSVMYRGSEGQIVAQLIQSGKRDVGGTISTPIIIDEQLVVA